MSTESFVMPLPRDTIKKKTSEAKIKQPINFLPEFLSFLNSCEGNTPDEKLATMAKHRISGKPLYIKYSKDTIGKQTFYILNYDQINSPPFNIYTDVCRSLLLGIDFNNLFYVAGRSYDRFPDFNENKVACDKLLKSIGGHTAKFHRVCEKKDGSIMMAVCLPMNDNKFTWTCMSRGKLMGTGSVGRRKITFGELFEKMLGGDINTILENANINKTYTLIFEIRDPEGGNHVITRYDDGFLCLLDVRKSSGEYLDSANVDLIATKLNVQRPTQLGENMTIAEVQSLLQKIYIKNPMYEGAVLIYEFENGMRYMMKLKHPNYYIFHQHMKNGRGPNLTHPHVALLLHVTNYLEIEMKNQNVTMEEITQINKIISTKQTLFDETLKWCLHSLKVKDHKQLAKEIATFPLRNFVFIARKTNLTNIKDFLDYVNNLWNESYETIIIHEIKKILAQQ